MSIQEEGQFFVRDVGALEKTVPIDNFIFITTDEREWNTANRIKDAKDEIKLEGTEGLKPR